MRTRMLASGLPVSALGLGCMGMSGGYGVEDRDQCVATLRQALDCGVSLIDTAHFYGGGEGERLVAEGLAGRRDEATIVVKAGIRSNPAGGMMLDGSPAFLRQACEESLERLATDRVDVYCLGWIDPEIPLEESVGAMSDLVSAGKVRHLALSEVSPANLRKAHAIHPISALATEYSLWQRHVEDEILAALEELGVGLLAYAALGRGFLTGTVGSLAELDEGDWRHNFPRFEDSNIAENLPLLEPLRAVATARGASMGQIAIAWLLGKGEHIVPLVGCKTPAHIAEDAEAAEIRLTPQETALLDASFPPDRIAGERYAPQIAALLDS